MERKRYFRAETDCPCAFNGLLPSQPAANRPPTGRGKRASIVRAKRVGESGDLVTRRQIRPREGSTMKQKSAPIRDD